MDIFLFNDTTALDWYCKSRLIISLQPRYQRVHGPISNLKISRFTHEYHGITFKSIHTMECSLNEQFLLFNKHYYTCIIDWQDWMLHSINLYLHHDNPQNDWIDAFNKCKLSKPTSISNRVCSSIIYSLTSSKMGPF